MARGTKVVNKVWYRSVSGLPVTRKTAGHRMGKGVGSFDSLCFPIPKGFIIFEIVEKEEIGPDVYRLLRAASKKLSIKTVVVIRGTNNLSLIKG
jgi:ribosomal protein L16/L10AE